MKIDCFKSVSTKLIKSKIIKKIIVRKKQKMSKVFFSYSERPNKECSGKVGEKFRDVVGAYGFKRMVHTIRN